MTSGLFTSALSSLQIDASRLSYSLIESLLPLLGLPFVSYSLCDYLTSPLPPLYPSTPSPTPPSPSWLTSLSTYAYSVSVSESSSEYKITDTDFRPFYADGIQSCLKPWETEGIDNR